MDTTLEQFVAMTATVNTNGKDYDKMYAKFGIDEERWQGIVAHFMAQIGTDAELGARFQTLMVAEVERLKGLPA